MKPHVLLGSKDLQLALGCTLRRYHSDNARELRYEDLVTILKDQGTAKTTTARHKSQRNGLFERQYQTIFNAVRAALANTK